MRHFLLFPVAHAAGVITDATPFSKVLLNILNFLLSVAGIIGILGLVLAGVWYLTANGDQKRIRLAKTAAYASVIGIVIILGALLLVGQIGEFFS
jgi:hypothetical protein